MGQLIRSQASYQVPMVRKRRAGRCKPLPLGRRHGFTAERVFPRETCTLEFLRGGGDSLERRPKPRSSGGEILGHRNDKAEAVLHIPQLRLAYEPGPIHVWVREHYPRKRFRQSHLEILLYECL